MLPAQPDDLRLFLGDHRVAEVNVGQVDPLAPVGDMHPVLDHGLTETIAWYRAHSADHGYLETAGA